MSKRQPCGRCPRVDLAEASPLTELGVVLNTHEVDAVLSAQSLDELLVRRLGAVIRENAELHEALVEHLGALAETTSEAIMAEGLLEHLLESRHSVEGDFLHDLSHDGGSAFHLHIF